MTTASTTTAVASTRAYADAYRTLLEVADRLRNGGHENVDTLVADFRQGMDAYRYCQERLDAIRTEIDREVEQQKPTAA